MRWRWSREDRLLRSNGHPDKPAVEPQLRQQFQEFRACFKRLVSLVIGRLSRSACWPVIQSIHWRSVVGFPRNPRANRRPALRMHSSAANGTCPSQAGAGTLALSRARHRECGRMPHLRRSGILPLLRLQSSAIAGSDSFDLEQAPAKSARLLADLTANWQRAAAVSSRGIGVV